MGETKLYRLGVVARDGVTDSSALLACVVGPFRQGQDVHQVVVHGRLHVLYPPHVAVELPSTRSTRCVVYVI